MAKNKFVAPEGCKDPIMGKRVAQYGHLKLPDNANRERILHHMRQCGPCKSMFADAALENVIKPALEKFAGEHGLTIEHTYELFMKGVQDKIKPQQ